jgi:hypothetical protein
VQSFLRDPEKTQRSVLGQMSWNPVFGEGNGYVVLFREFFTEPSDRSTNAKIIKLGGMKLVRKSLNIASDLGTPVLDFLHVSLCGRG